MKLSTCIHLFFDQYLPRIKGVSSNTVKSYRDTFKLFLRFAAKHRSIKIESIKVKHLTPNLILSFLDHLESNRKNMTSSRNQRLVAIKSMAKMIRFMYPEQRDLADRILNIPQKRMTKSLIGFLAYEESLKVFEAVNLTRKEGVRDYTILNLLYNSGARASEIATLNLDYFDSSNNTLGILGKGDRYRLIELWPRTVHLLELYITRYRVKPKPIYQNRIFINQRGKEFTRHGIYRICKKYLHLALPPKKLKWLNPVHSFRHGCAVNMLATDKSLSEIRNHLGHVKIETTMIYLHMDLSMKKETQKKFIEYTTSVIGHDAKLNELIDWNNKKDTLAWLDSL